MSRCIRCNNLLHLYQFTASIQIVIFCTRILCLKMEGVMGWITEDQFKEETRKQEVVRLFFETDKEKLNLNEGDVAYIKVLIQNNKKTKEYEYIELKCEKDGQYDEFSPRDVVRVEREYRTRNDKMAKRKQAATGSAEGEKHGQSPKVFSKEEKADIARARMIEQRLYLSGRGDEKFKGDEGALKKFNEKHEQTLSQLAKGIGVKEFLESKEVKEYLAKLKVRASKGELGKL